MWTKDDIERMERMAAALCESDHHDAELAKLRTRVKELEGVVARSNSAVLAMYEQMEHTAIPTEWERRLDDLDEALCGAYPHTRGDAEWEAVNARLDDAVKVVEAAIEWKNSDGWIETSQDDRLANAVREYESKYRKIVR